MVELICLPQINLEDNLEEMQVISFLEQLNSISLEQNQKENQILSQKLNSRRSSQTAPDKLPFRQWAKVVKTKKNITFRLLDQPPAEEHNTMEDSLGVCLPPEKLQVKTDSSKMPTNQTLHSMKNSQKGSNFGANVFPSTFAEKMKILRTLR